MSPRAPGDPGVTTVAPSGDRTGPRSSISAWRDTADGALSQLRRRLDDQSSPRIAGVAVAVLAVGIAASTVLGPTPILVAMALAGGLVALRSPVAWLAFGWGILLPIEVMRGIPDVSLDVARYLGALALVVRLAPDVRFRDPPWPRWAGLAGGVALMLALTGAVHQDRSGIGVGLVMGSALVTALFVAVRPSVHRRILQGFVAGASLSAVVVVMQVLAIPTLGPGADTRLRYPGLSTQTSTLTWQMAMALVIATAFALRRATGPVAARAAYPALAVCLFALLACGAQGGILGLIAVVAVLGPGGRSGRFSLTRRQVLVAAAALGVIALTVVGAALVLDVDGFPPEKGFVNESTRWDSAVAGVGEIVDHPLTGMTATAFRAEHQVLPHTVPIQVGVVSGVVGLGLALALVVELVRVVARGRRRPEAACRLGAAMAVVVLANSLVEAGTFVGLGRITMVLLAVALVGAHRDRSPPPSPPVEATVAPARRRPASSPGT